MMWCRPYNCRNVSKQHWLNREENHLQDVSPYYIGFLLQNLRFGIFQYFLLFLSPRLNLLLFLTGIDFSVQVLDADHISLCCHDSNIFHFQSGEKSKMTTENYCHLVAMCSATLFFISWSNALTRNLFISLFHNWGKRGSLIDFFPWFNIKPSCFSCC